MANRKLKLGIKIAGFTLLGLIVLLLVIPLFFQKQMVNIALKEANKMLNAEVSIGDFRLSLIRNFPNPTLRIEDVVVANKGTFEGDTLAKIGNFDACFNLMSLFSDEYHLKKLALNDVWVNLKVNQDTIPNWDIVIPDSLQVEDTTTEPIQFNLKVDKISLTNIDVHYADIPADMYADVEKLNFSFSGNLSDKVTSLTMDMSTKSVNLKMDKILYLKEAVLGLKTKINADLEHSKYTIIDNEIGINSLILQLDGWVAMPEDDIDMDVKLSLKKNEFKNILSLIPAIYTKDFNDVKTKGTLALSAYAKGKLTDSLYPAFGLDLLIGDAMFQYPSLPAAVNNININAKVNNAGGHLDNTVIDVKKFHFNIINNPFDVFALIKTPISDPNINVGLKGTLNLGDVKKVYPLDANTDVNGVFQMDVALKGLLSYIEKEQYDKFDAKGSMFVQNVVLKNTDFFEQNVHIPEAKLTFSSAFAELEKLTLNLGRNDLNIKGKVENYIPFIFKDEGVLKGNLSVNSTYLNVNDLTSQPVANSSDASATANQSAESEPLSLIQVPNNLDVNASLNVKKLIYDNLEMDNAALACSVADSRLTIKNLSAGLLAGDIKMNGYYETKQINRGVADINLAVNRISPQVLCKTFGLFDKFMPILNTAQGKVSMTMKGNLVLKETMEPDYQTVNLDGTLALSDMNINGSEGVAKVADALKIDKLKNLSMKDVHVSYTLADGKLRTKPFAFKIDKSNVAVESGTIGLDKSLNYTASIDLPKSIMGTQAVAMLGQLTAKAKSLGVSVPESDVIKFSLKIGGTIDKPKIDVGLDKMKDQVKETVEEVIEQVKEQVKEVVKENVNKALEEAQKQANTILAEAQRQADALLKAEKEAADRILSQARTEADKIIASSSNPLEKAAKKLAADKVMQEAEKKAVQANKEAQNKADKMIADARNKGNKLIEDAKRQ